jgi:ferredoxin-NADP reductase
MAEDGYRAERSYSISSPPESTLLDLTVDRIDVGEVSPYLTGELRTGDMLEIRGPIGGHFVWAAAHATRPLLLVGGGSGVAPLMCILRHRRMSSSSIPTALLYSARTQEEVIFSQELGTAAESDPTLRVLITLTRETVAPPNRTTGRINLSQVQSLLTFIAAADADIYIAGSSGFVERAAELILETGQPAHAVKTERFGPTGAIVT